MKLVNINTFMISILVALLLSLAISFFSEIPFWGALLVIIVAIFINGVIAEKEENEPGGFLNPDGSSPK